MDFQSKSVEKCCINSPDNWVIINNENKEHFRGDLLLTFPFSKASFPNVMLSVSMGKRKNARLIFRRKGKLNEEETTNYHEESNTGKQILLYGLGWTYQSYLKCIICS